jgi:hypothetical protein
MTNESKIRVRDQSATFVFTAFDICLKSSGKEVAVLLSRAELTGNFRVHVLTMQHKIFHALSFFDKGVGAR